jgi:hypothetical protein
MVDRPFISAVITDIVTSYVLKLVVNVENPYSVEVSDVYTDDSPPLIELAAATTSDEILL